MRRWSVMKNAHVQRAIVLSGKLRIGFSHFHNNFPGALSRATMRQLRSTEFPFSTSLYVTEKICFNPSQKRDTLTLPPREFLIKWRRKSGKSKKKSSWWFFSFFVCFEIFTWTFVCRPLHPGSGWTFKSTRVPLSVASHNPRERPSCKKLAEEVH